MVLSPFPLPNITKIDFDDVPDHTAIDNHYASKGVTFASITTNPSKQWEAYARTALSPVTQPNVVSVHKTGLVVGFDARDGGIQVIFRRPQRFVGITAQAAVIDEILGQQWWPIARPFLEFWNDKGGFIPATQYYPFVYGDPNWGSKGQLSFVAPDREIGKVVFSCQISSPYRVFGVFDHLVFSEEFPYPPPVPSVLGAGA